MNHIEICRIAGIPIYLDMMFVLILILFSYPYFTSGNTQLMSIGIVVIAGLLLSVLLHELGHAFAGWLCRSPVSHIELTGLGGVAHFERSLPPSLLVQSSIFLAGPAVNLLLWLGLAAASDMAVSPNTAMLAMALGILSSANFWLGCFNLLPAYPLDGGRTLDAWLGAILGGVWPVRIVAIFGLMITAYLALTSFPDNFWRMLLAFFLFQTNWTALQSVGGWNRR